jgi:hypothetical protein
MLVLLKLQTGKIKENLIKRKNIQTVNNDFVDTGITPIFSI